MKSFPSWSTRKTRPLRRPKHRPQNGIERLEPRHLLNAAFPEFVDPNPNPGNMFGDTVAVLSTGNVVITSPFDDAGGTDAGAVYLFNGTTGELIGTLKGSTADDNVGRFGVTPLTNGNYVVSSYFWDNVSGSVQNAGAATLVNGTTGVIANSVLTTDVVSPSNSLVGSFEGRSSWFCHSAHQRQLRRHQSILGQ